MIEEMCDTYYEAINWARHRDPASSSARPVSSPSGCSRARREQTRGRRTRGSSASSGGEPWFNGERFGWGDCLWRPRRRLGDVRQRARRRLAARGLARAHPAAPERRPTFEAAAASMQGFEMVPGWSTPACSSASTATTASSGCSAAAASTSSSRACGTRTFASHASFREGPPRTTRRTALVSNERQQGGIDSFRRRFSSGT